MVSLLVLEIDMFVTPDGVDSPTERSMWDRAVEADNAGHINIGLSTHLFSIAKRLKCRIRTPG